ncbi:MAG TPA: alcohol dehydrogenase catalytic domain-containing protein, partial [Nitrospinaceae bacterium]|nr:alcohol dehydrogenase catalytic domain-containing protein [Nitrospinaceae bacterium]
MKKIILRRSGGPEVLEVKEVKDPEVKDGEVLIDIRATGLNWSEVMIRRGDWPIKIQNGFCLGSEGAGVVEKIG